MNIYLTDEMETAYNIEFFEMLTSATLATLNAKLDAKTELSLLLTDDESIHALNLQYREKDRPTDVLSFEMNDEIMLGDIVISIDTAIKQANDADIALEREVAFLFIHGFLHLLGYDHETSEEDEKEMFALQENILKTLVDNGKVA